MEAVESLILSLYQELGAVGGSVAIGVLSLVAVYLQRNIPFLRRIGSFATQSYLDMIE